MSILNLCKFNSNGLKICICVFVGDLICYVMVFFTFLVSYDYQIR